MESQLKSVIYRVRGQCKVTKSVEDLRQGWDVVEEGRKWSLFLLPFLPLMILRLPRHLALQLWRGMLDDAFVDVDASHELLQFFALACFPRQLGFELLLSVLQPCHLLPMRFLDPCKELAVLFLHLSLEDA